MKAISDEGVPRRVARMLGDMGCDVSSFPNDWKGLKNGRLLARVKEQGFGVLVTCDKNLSFQQDLHRSGVALVVLPSQFFTDLIPLAIETANAVRAAKAGEVLIVRSQT